MKKPTTLAEYLYRERMTQRAFARVLGISPSHLCDIMANRRRPSLAVAVRIELETGIPVEVWTRQAA